MDKTIEKGGGESYEHIMKKFLDDMKVKPSRRANKDWDLTEKMIDDRQRGNDERKRKKTQAKRL